MRHLWISLKDAFIKESIYMEVKERCLLILATRLVRFVKLLNDGKKPMSFTQNL